MQEALKGQLGIRVNYTWNNNIRYADDPVQKVDNKNDFRRLLNLVVLHSRDMGINKI